MNKIAARNARVGAETTVFGGPWQEIASVKYVRGNITLRSASGETVTLPPGQMIPVRTTTTVILGQ